MAPNDAPKSPDTRCQALSANIGLPKAKKVTFAPGRYAPSWASIEGPKDTVGMIMRSNINEDTETSETET